MDKPIVFDLLYGDKVVASSEYSKYDPESESGSGINYLFENMAVYVSLMMDKHYSMYGLADGYYLKKRDSNIKFYVDCEDTSVKNFKSYEEHEQDIFDYVWKRYRKRGDGRMSRYDLSDPWEITFIFPDKKTEKEFDLGYEKTYTLITGSIVSEEDKYKWDYVDAWHNWFDDIAVEVANDFFEVGCINAWEDCCEVSERSRPIVDSMIEHHRKGMVG